MSPERATLESFARRIGVVSLTRDTRPKPVEKPAAKEVCDVCAALNPSVRRVEPGELRPTAAPWITVLCARCRRRLGRVEPERTADPVSSDLTFVSP